MEEKAYKTMGITGGLSIAIGIVTIVGGIVLGVLSIVNGGKLLKRKSEIMFQFFQNEDDNGLNRMKKGEAKAPLFHCELGKRK